MLDANAARRARRALDAAGGLVGRGGIARGLQPRMSQPSVHNMTTSESFPAPYARIGNTPVWIVADVAAWFTANGRTWTPPPLGDTATHHADDS